MKEEKEKIALKLGKMTNQEIAKWFGITSSSFSKYKNKKIEELKYFADFEEINGKFLIKKIISPYYNKQENKTYKKVKDKINEVWNENGLDTCSRVSSKIYNILTKEDNNFNNAISTVEAYTRKGRNELYGIPFSENGGNQGKCIYLWAKRDKKTGEYSFLNEEEKIKKEKLQTKYFGDATEKQILVKGMIEAGEISKEEAWNVLEEMTNMKTGNFMAFLTELQKEIGCQVVRATYVERKIPLGIYWNTV